ncbi:MAG: hypothetical protein Q8P95_01780, partial [bacterium]|nr:hypothetical protein [bacterium]
SDAAKTSQAARDLADELGLEAELKRIECYDISHMGGEQTTASMVVFLKGSPEKKEYRHFKLKELENGEIDDCKSLQEILRRRLQRLSQFSAPNLKGYSFKKPLKKDQETIQKTLETEEDLDWSRFVGLYYQAEAQESNLVGFASFSHPNTPNRPTDHNTLTVLGQTWIEGEHLNRALKHQLWSQLIEKVKTTHLYVACKKDEKEDYLSFGFTELKKVPEFLKKQTPNSQLQTPHSLLPTPYSELTFLIYKISKKTKDDTSFTQTPDLIILDGGKGQLNAGLEVLKSSGLNIPMIGLAKREEEIFLPKPTHQPSTPHLPTGLPAVVGQAGSPLPTPNSELPTPYSQLSSILLAKNSQALYLVQRLRDESHRFANELRKKLGGKKLTASEIDDIPGIGLIIKRRLLKQFGSINAIKSAPMADLERVVGQYIAKMLKEKLGGTEK